MSGRIRTKKFWISLAGIIIMLLQLFGLKINTPIISEIVNSICAVCVVIGLIGDSDEDGSNDQGESE